MSLDPDRLLKTTTDALEVAFLQGGDANGKIALLLHGWPDDATTWTSVASELSKVGVRTIMPWLRGFGQTRFLSPSTHRDGRTEALAQDALDLMDALKIERFSVIGHDWGARVAYALAAVVPERLESVTALSLGYSPRDAIPVPPFRQSRAWWYQWFMSVDRGAEAVAEDPRGFARIMWETWSPQGWFDEKTFEMVARSFENPDWLAITLSNYRGRWRDEPRDPRYDPLHQKIASTEQLGVPTLMIQGGADGTVLAKSTEGKDKYFTGSYRRIVLDDVGHFPTREAPAAVAGAIMEHLS
ncbi:alpha/beta hydrolase [bacterium M00.F.Ca.ET.159.01.1.1]|nr:alpha/beta hydrolase [bacterium M00.F.Ca.ET.159.01.1.1]TGT81549.1 alpha/beta hydrolase [bacterium M00.F.Ca.ET.157.01.1.1]